ncbi:NACHT domain-containing protein [Saccharothrix xinjiangensis]|uniref:NACHT domain-containing protein n=1 Tax=Saccharothrix xinjiangensis TaxID=204798 RepID=A0ABV9Y9N7_9PSEU
MEPSAQERAFGAEVERRRAAAGVTQEWVGRRIGLSRTKVSEMGNGLFLPGRQALDALVIALALDEQRAVELWQAAREGREARRRAERVDRRPAPEGWSALPVLPVEVRSLLEAQEESARRMPYRLRGARTPSLDTVYVRQDLGTGADEQHEDHRTEPELDERGLLRERAAPKPRLAVRPPARTVQEALDDDEHLLVTGGPGQGKSTLSLRLAGELAALWLGGAEPPPLAEVVLPLRVTARELAKRLDLPFPKALVESCRADYGSLLWSEVEPGQVTGRVAGCRWLLLVDGLDEVADPDDQARLVRVLERCARSGTPYRVVVTTRPIEGTVLAPLQRVSAARYELQPFDEEAFRRFARRWFDPERAERFLRQAREAHLDELVRVPLLATIAAIVFEQHDDRPLPDNQYELYEAYLGYLLAGRENPPCPFDHLRDGLLEHLGRVRLETDVSLVAAAREWVSARVAVRVGWTEDLTSFLTAVGPLVHRGDDLRFLHHSFAEHLAATARARELPPGFDAGHHDFPALVHAALQGDRGRHARAVLLHYTRLRPDQADRLVEWLHGGGDTHHVLAARLLAQHLPASSGVIDGFLTTVRGWAMTKRYPGTAILGHASRIAHHPALEPWLLGIMRDAHAPWASRIEAATALATRLRADTAPEAVALLRSAVESPSVTVADRLGAAESLAHCGAPEREAAERGLDAVLASRFAKMAECRTAAVVLAGLGHAGRARAVEALLGFLDDPLLPNGELVEAATGLAEIAVEFHQRCAEVLGAVLHDPVRSMRGRDDAAIALATLGSQHLEHAAAALTELIARKAPHYEYHCVQAAKTLGRLGPQHRAAAAQHLRDMAADPVHRHSLRDVLVALNDLGVQDHEQAATRLREVIDDHESNENTVYWAIDALLDLGPAYRAEGARALLRLADDPLVTGFERAAALERLAELGEPHRVDAVSRLRAELADADLRPSMRHNAATRLAQISPELHREVIDQLLQVLDADPPRQDAFDIWRTLSSLDDRYSEAADEALARLAVPVEENVRGPVIYGAAWGIGENTRNATVEALAQVILDPSQSTSNRDVAAHTLMSLDHRAHPLVLDAVIELWRSGRDNSFSSPFVSRRFLESSRSTRERLAHHLREVIRHPDTDHIDVIRAAGMLADLGEQDGATVDVLREIGSDPLAEPYARREAVNLLGATPTTSVEAQLNDGDATCDSRYEAAKLLIETHGSAHRGAVSELERQAADPHLSPARRSRALMDLVRLGAPPDSAIEHLRDVLADEDADTGERCGAARDLVRLDRSHWADTVALLRRSLRAPGTTPEGRAELVEGLDRLNAIRFGEEDSLVLPVVHHPGADGHVRRWMVRFLSGRAWRTAQHDMLTDTLLPLRSRLPRSEDPALVDQAIAVARDVLTAPESPAEERVSAANALIDLSPESAPEAEEVLLGMTGRLFFTGRGSALRRRLLEDDLRLVADATAPRNTRFRAARFVDDLCSTPPAPVVDFLDRVIADERASTRLRIEAAFRLRHVRGLAGLRAVRDDERTAPATRRQVSTLLRDFLPEDRAAGAAVLWSIATDRAHRPASRCAAARDLALFGAAGRTKAAEVARSMAEDPDLPTTARIAAAGLLGRTARSRRREVLSTLRELAENDNPLHRLLALRAIGELAPLEAAPPLRAMTRDRDLPPVARLRCAEALLRVHRGHRESAVPAARDVAFDDTVPWHVRVHAARDLARWSEVLRDDARRLLRTLPS